MSVAILWFRKCLRIHDNQTLSWAFESNQIKSILPIYIFEEDIDQGSTTKMNENRLRFQYECVHDLQHNLDTELGLKLHIFSGQAQPVIQSILNKFEDQRVCLISEYCSDRENMEKLAQIDSKIIDQNPNWFSKTFPASHTILDIESIVNSSKYKPPNSMNDMIQIFSKEFGDWRNIVFGVTDINSSDYQPKQCQIIESEFSTTLEEFKPRPNPSSYFIGGESIALQRLENKVLLEKQFVKNFSKPNSISTNTEGNPFEPTTTGLSPYLSTGCLSVRRLWNACSEIQQLGEHTKPPVSIHGQLMFREMFYLLSRSVMNWDQDKQNTHCKEIEWGTTKQSLLAAWESGETGFPLIDAMMRQLDATGWMHHLGRHAVSCFLTRGQLWQSWTHGRDIFSRKLIDSDWAINNGNWIWLAGVAPFSMPYYRVYNPCPNQKSSLNVETETANFIRHWVPELSEFPSKYIYEPHLAPLSVQQSAGCIIGDDYPNPIVDRIETRRENLERFKQNLTALR